MEPGRHRQAWAIFNPRRRGCSVKGYEQIAGTDVEAAKGRGRYTFSSPVGLKENEKERGEEIRLKGLTCLSAWE
jgi:hypothetical protein